MDAVLIFGGVRGAWAPLGRSRRMGENELHLTVNSESGGERALALVFESDPGRALRLLGARAFDRVLVDGRREAEVGAAAAGRFLEQLFPAFDAGAPVRRQHTLVLVDDDAAGATLAFRAGQCRAGGLLVAPDAVDALAQLLALGARAAQGKVALCLAGGGIEGLLYELGVLRAIDSYLRERKLVDADLFFGISAGSVIGALMANGMSPEEIAHGLRHGTERLDRMTRGDLFDLHVSEFARRALGLARDVAGLGDARNALSALYRAIPVAGFAGDRLREWLRKQLERPGMSDSFDELRRPLFVGATDQDTSEAVVFGEPGWRDVPVHKAVRASCALTPFYAPEKIGGRYYTDGAFTRTTNMRVAAKHGATLALLVDPLVPVVADRAGYVARRGGLFAAMQGLKSLINGRFDKAATTIREMYPEVAFHIFRPEDDEMRVLSGSPMKFLYRQEIEELAYQRTLRKLRTMPALGRDLARHGFVFGEPPRTHGAHLAFEEALARA